MRSFRSAPIRGLPAPRPLPTLRSLPRVRLVDHLQSAVVCLRRGELGPGVLVVVEEEYNDSDVVVNKPSLGRVHPRELAQAQVVDSARLVQGHLYQPPGNRLQRAGPDKSSNRRAAQSDAWKGDAKAPAPQGRESSVAGDIPSTGTVPELPLP